MLKRKTDFIQTLNKAHFAMNKKQMLRTKNEG